MPKGKESVNYSVPGSKNKFSFDKEDTANKTLAEFQEHEKHSGLSEAQLKEVWQFAREKKEPEELKEGFVEGPIVGEEVETTGKGKSKNK